MNTQTGRSKVAKARKTLTKDEQFFFDHAGYSYGQGETPLQGQIRCAKSLTLAEHNGRELGITFDWPWDEAGCSGCDCGSKDCACSTGTDHETLCCVAYDAAGKVQASLGGICSPSREYRRVVEAELADESVDAIRKEGARVNA